jgi:hypothetical protein
MVTNHPTCEIVLWDDGTMIADVFGVISSNLQDSLVVTLRKCEIPPSLIRFWKPDSLMTMRSMVGTMASNDIPSSEELNMDQKHNLLREVILKK